jgi:putative redox protein
MPEAKAVWTSEMQFLGETGSGHAIVLDTPADAGGRGTGPSPMELVLLGLAGCTGMDIVFILKQRMKKPVTAVQVAVSGTRADEAPKVYTAIEITYRITGRGLELKDALRAMQLSSSKYCSVEAMLRKTAQIRARWELVDELTGETLDGALEPEGAVER